MAGAAGADYGDSLRSTLDAARKQILDLGQSTAARRQQAVLALGHAEQALSVAESVLDRNRRDLSNAHVINGVAVQGGALIQSAEQLGDLAKAAAEGANSALSVAATSIKTLASAFDSLAGSIAGVHSIAKNDDFGSAMARSAANAEHATNRADDTVEQLKAASLVASIQSAKSMAASAATHVNAVGSEIQDLVDRASALLGATQQRVSDSLKQRAAAAQAERAAQKTYSQAKIDSEALDDGTTRMDSILNGSLVVTAEIPPSPGKPTLSAKYTIPFQTGDACYFFALLEADAPGFSYNDAKTAVVKLDLDSTSSTKGVTKGVIEKSNAKPGESVVYTVQIHTTTSGEEIAAGQSYRVFVLHVPKEGPYATNASDLSYPSRSLSVAGTIPEQEQYKIQATEKQRNDAPEILFKVEIQTPQKAADYIMEYRVFLLLEDVYQALRAVQGDTVLLASQLAPSSYKSQLAPPASSSSGASVKFSYQEGDTDAYGDIITPDTNKYEILVLLVPKSSAMQNALLPAKPYPPPPYPTQASLTPQSSGAPARTTTSTGEPALAGAAPSTGQTPPGTGAQ
jgi:hypothetical protein